MKSAADLIVRRPAWEALGFAVLLLSVPAIGQDFKPYATPKITQAQWQRYFDEVKGKHANSAREVPAQHLVLFEDAKSRTSYAFTQPGHPAHPAWVARRVVQSSTAINIDQVGYFAGDEPAFEGLFRAYLDLNDRIRQDIRTKLEKGGK